MKYNQMTNNYFFRFYKCGLSVEKTAELCFKTVRQVNNWDKGAEIPPECKRLMRMYCERKIGLGDSWQGFSIVKNKLRLPTGRELEPQQILTAVALLEIESIEDKKTLTKLVKVARNIAEIRITSNK
ncbi:regulator [Aliivibrio fischeri]|uniref:regulator n=1 Tax=Aliivibrio fischeri TaxID=668 RepID=UPI001F1878A5|nr:regulator [Aliivibrio fischeri]MCE7534834.1 regulator [Aliivibrio fischeri]MCE7557330.1 regulator [Aliivibrio fischeri]